MTSHNQPWLQTFMYEIWEGQQVGPRGLGQGQLAAPVDTQLLFGLF